MVSSMNKETKKEVSGGGCLVGLLGFAVLIYGLAIMSFWLAIISFFICLGGFLAGLFLPHPTTSHGTSRSTANFPAHF